MFAIIIGTHGKLSEELLKACEIICGETKNVRAISFLPGEGPEDMAKKYEDAVEELDTGNGVLFLNDLFGGSPYNAACRLVINNEQYGIVTGVSLPMLIEMVNAQLADDSAGISQLMAKAVDAGQSGVKTFHASTIVADGSDG